MSGEITRQINTIINKRKTNADEIKQRKESLESIKLGIINLENLRQQIIYQPENKPFLVEQLRQINFSKLLEVIVQEQQVWENLWKRFNRDTVNIGVVGLARQGKSTFLQKVSGLSKDEIPSSDRMPCTSVQSNIYHAKEDTYGLVYFHSESSFLEQVITPYYEELGFPNPPKTLEEFRNKPFPSAPTNHYNPARAESIYKHLRDEYYKYLDQYAHLLEPQKRVDRIPKDKIKEYVSQEYDDDSHPLFFNHLAVEKVEIFCTFPETDVEKIALVDMPGLGDTRLGDEERMIKALGQDVDFILFIRRPDNCGDLWKNEDTRLYDAAFQALKDRLLLQDWSFMVLNFDGSNNQQCTDLENTRVNKGIHVAQCITANCNHPDQANLVLGQVLVYLVKNIESLDRQYMSACESSLKALQINLEAELKKARTALEQYGDGYAEYVLLRNQFIKDLYNKIEEFRNQLRQEPKQPDPDFKNQVDAAITRCNQYTGIPSLLEIQSQANCDGIDAAYFWSIQQMRTSLLQQFHPIEIGLKKSLEKIKFEVAEILINLGLRGLSKKQGIAFLEMVAEEVPASLKSLKLGFEFISTFDFLYKGFIQSIVWKKVSQVLPSNPNEPLGTPGDGNAIITNLQERHQQAVENCQQALNGLAMLLTDVAHSMIEEFADHITRNKGVEQEWDIFLGKVRCQVWPQLQELEERRQLQQEWMKLIDEVVSINQKLAI